jgi:hypothetical protein
MCVIPTAISSRSDNILKQRSTVSKTMPVKLPNDDVSDQDPDSGLILAVGWPALTIMRRRDPPFTLQKTLAHSFCLRRATIPKEWNDRPALSGKTGRGPKRLEGGSLRRLTAQHLTRSQCFLPWLHKLHLNCQTRRASSQVRARIDCWAVETKRPWRWRPACGCSRQSEAALQPTSRPGTARMKGRWLTNRRRTPGIFSG